MDNQVFIIISAVLFGLVVGAIIMYFASGSSKNEQEKIAQVEKKLNKYQQDVVQHFETTADLVDDLTQSYKKVFDHLSVSAKQLLTDEQVKEQIEKRKDKKVVLGFLSDDSQAKPETEVEKTESPADAIDKFAQDLEDNQAESIEETVNDETSDEMEQSEQAQLESTNNDEVSDDSEKALESDDEAMDEQDENLEQQDEQVK